MPCCAKSPIKFREASASTPVTPSFAGVSTPSFAIMAHSMAIPTSMEESMAPTASAVRISTQMQAQRMSLFRHRTITTDTRFIRGCIRTTILMVESILSMRIIHTEETSSISLLRLTHMTCSIRQDT